MDSIPLNNKRTFVMTAFCDTRWTLFFEYTRQTGLASRHLHHNRESALSKLQDHQNTCQTCREHLAAMSKLSSQAVHPEYDNATSY